MSRRLRALVPAFATVGLFAGCGGGDAPQSAGDVASALRDHGLCARAEPVDNPGVLIESAKGADAVTKSFVCYDDQGAVTVGLADFRSSKDRDMAAKANPDTHLYTGTSDGTWLLLAESSEKAVQDALGDAMRSTQAG